MAPWNQQSSMGPPSPGAPHTRTLAFPAPFFFFLLLFLPLFAVARSHPLSLAHDDPVRSQAASPASSRKCIATPRCAARSKKPSRDESASCTFTTSHTSQASDSWRPFSVRGIRVCMGCARKPDHPPFRPHPSGRAPRAIRATSRGTGRRALIGRYARADTRQRSLRSLGARIKTRLVLLSVKKSSKFIDVHLISFQRRKNVCMKII